MRQTCLALIAGVGLGCTAPTDPMAQTGSGQPMRFASSDIELAGILYLPSGRGPFPGVVLVHGSGRVRAVDHIGLAREFVGRGFAVLSYDKRGVGGSGGMYQGIGALNSDSMIRVLAGDAVGGLQALARDSRIDPRRLGLAGGSQAGWIIPNAATRFPVAFSVIISGPLVTVGQEIFYSNVFENSNRPLEAVDSVLSTYHGPAGYDPVPDVRQMSGAVFWVWGEKDRSIPAPRCAAIASSLIGELGRSRWRGTVYPEGDHSMATVPFWPSAFGWLSEVLR